MDLAARAAHLLRRLRRLYGVDEKEGQVVFAPYRICPLGAHIDHQGGPVTAMALDRGVLLAYAPAAGPQVRLSSLSFSGQIEFSLNQIPARPVGDWGDYARGAARALQARYTLPEGLVGLTEGRLGEGGLSSSAAVGVAYLLALEQINGLAVSRADNILLDQAIENGYLGLRNGILDQGAILWSRRGKLALIDCAQVDCQWIEPGANMPDWTVLVAFSGLRQALVGTDYNQRVGECAEAARLLLEAVGRPGQKPLLGAVEAEEYRQHKDVLQGAVGRRAAHFFSEVERVEQGVELWRQGDLAGFGAAMWDSGASSIHKYECGCQPLIDLYEILGETEGVYGARFSGAGFRGCCVGLVAAAAAEAAVERVRREYARRQPDLADEAPVLVCATGNGARILSTA